MKNKKNSVNIMIPRLGLGTHRIQSIDTLVNALKVGYRHLDTATAYQNHELIKEALKAYPVKREELFIVTKINSTDVERGLENRIEEILDELGLSEIDCMLIHSPSVPYEFALTVLQKYVNKGVLKSLGVSNFNQDELKSALKLDIPLICNQIELHPYYYTRDLIKYCKESGIEIVAYRPFGAARVSVLSDPIIAEIAKNHGVKSSQVILAWLLQQGFAVIPRSNQLEHLQDNFNSQKILLKHEEIERVTELSLTHSEPTCTTWIN